MMTKLSSGFTLVELLIALFVFSLLSAFAFQAVTLLGDSNEQLIAEQRDIQDIQKALTVLERDLRSMTVVIVPEETQSVNSASESGETGKEILRLAGTSLANSMGWKGIQQVRYFLDKESLYREQLQAEGDRAGLLLLSLIQDASVEFSGNTGLTDAGAQSPFSGAKLLLTHQIYGQIQRDIHLALASADKDLNTLRLEESGGTSAGGAPENTASIEASASAGTSNDSNPENTGSTASSGAPDPLGGQAIW